MKDLIIFVFNMQYADQCFCGDEYGRHGEDVSGEGCNMDCAGDSSQNCGGPWRNAVYSVRRMCFPLLFIYVICISRSDIILNCVYITRL